MAHWEVQRQHPTTKSWISIHHCTTQKTLVFATKKKAEAFLRKFLVVNPTAKPAEFRLLHVYSVLSTFI